MSDEKECDCARCTIRDACLDLQRRGFDVDSVLQVLIEGVMILQDHSDTVQVHQVELPQEGTVH